VRAWSDADVAAERMRRHGLTTPAADAVAAARRSAGLQAQDLPASRLAVRARTRGLTVQDAAAATDDGRLVRTWLMRSTLHAVPAADVGWLVRLFGPIVARRDRRRRRSLGLDDALCERALAALPGVLAGGPLTRAALVAALAREGVEVNPKGQAPAHLVAFAAASGLVCRGPEDGSEPTYVLLESWVADTDGPDGEDAVTELARRHLAAYAPATAADVATWAGLPLTAVRRAVAALGDEVTPVPAESTAAGHVELLAPAGTVRPPAASRRAWRLLPAFDSYLLGYADRAAVLDPAHARRVNAGGGWLHPCVVHGGRVVGTWRLDRAGGGVAVDLFDAGTGAAPDAAGRRALAAEARDVGRFLGVETELRSGAETARGGR
jgi:hypothetical protein